MSPYTPGWCLANIGLFLSLAAGVRVVEEEEEEKEEEEEEEKEEEEEEKGSHCTCIDYTGGVAEGE